MILGFAGAGNIAEALARGWADAEQGPEAMIFCDNGSGRAQKLAERTGGEAVTTLKELALRSDAVILAVKPNALEIVAEKLDHEARAVASVLGATSVDRLRELFPGIPVLRTMPTVATEIGEGVICHAPLTAEDGEIGARLVNLFGQLGHMAEIPDNLLDAATAVMGCSPAYLAVVVQNLAEAGAEQGLEFDQAYELVIETFAGTIDLLRQYDPIEVRGAVASPGGSTEAGLEALADAGAADAFQDAVRASMARMRG
jgi:pyrroline-5-carboxylate reductase